MRKNQLEIPLNAAANCRPRPRPAAPRRVRAAWWFSQMHQVVDRAIDWSAAPRPRPEQLPLTLARGR